MAEHGNECGIYVEESSGERTPANTEGSAQNEGTGAGFGTAESFFVTFMLDGSGQLLRHELQNFPAF
jgi:hypothetical protein